MTLEMGRTEVGGKRKWELGIIDRKGIRENTY
jgi:hypothetical protein